MATPTSWTPTVNNQCPWGLSSLSGILAAYVDLPGLGVRPLGPFSPFVGGGLGAARVASGETRMTFPKTRTLVPGTRRTGLTWRLTAGLGMSWGERATLDLAWRYTDAGVIETGAGQGRVEWLDGSRDPVGLDLAPTQAPLRSHGLHLSLRYEPWIDRDEYHTGDQRCLKTRRSCGESRKDGKGDKGREEAKKCGGAAFSVGGSVAKPGLAKAAVAALAVGDAIMRIAVGVRGLVKQIKLILTQLNRIESKLDRVIESLEKGQREKRKTAQSR